MGEVSRSRVFGRYALYDKIAAGGMATVHIGRLLGPVGFSRTVAIKRLRSDFAEEPEFVAMFLDEARLAARIHHPNVVATLDVVSVDGELLLVMEYVPGESLSRLLRGSVDSPPPSQAIVVSIMAGALHGLHAAHEARNEQGEPLGIVHRDVSPHNIIVGVDGVARVLDFGVAKAAGRLQTTREGQIKGKISYMAPEQLLSKGVDRRTDVYGASAVLWEALTGKRLFVADSDGATMRNVLEGEVDPPSKHVPGVSPQLEAIALRGLSRDPDARFATAREMALALEAAVAPIVGSVVSAWVDATAHDELVMRARLLEAIEGDSAIKRAALNSSTSMPVVDEAASDVQMLTDVADQTGTSVVSPFQGGGKPAKRRSMMLVVLGAIGGIALFVGLGIVGARRSNVSPAAVTTTVASAVPTDSAILPATSVAVSSPAVTPEATSSATVPVSSASSRHGRRFSPPRPTSTPSPSGHYVFDHL